MRQIRAFYVALILLATPFCMAGDLAIVVNKSNAISNVSAAELEKLLKTAVQNWPDGKRVKIFLTDPGFSNPGLTSPGFSSSGSSQGSADTRMILQRAYKMKPEEIRSLVEAHKADIQVVGSDEIVLTMVDSNPGAIGIVNVYSINSHVKVLKVDEKLPMEQGYLLHGN
jgi:ABC-type phosphate transport system substrate-binding protein